MSHRKFERPRHGHLGFSPRKQASRPQGRNDPSKPPHFTAFLGYKAGMTHVLRDLDRPGSKLHKKEIVEAVTIIETPPLVCVGLVGYKETTRGIKPVTLVMAAHLSEGVRRRLTKNWMRSKKNCYTNYAKLFEETKMEDRIQKIRNSSISIRAICHTQVEKCLTRVKRAHMAEIQINGGSIDEKVDFVLKQFEQLVPVSAVFTDNECIDTIAVTRGRGKKGVVARWGVTRLPRKTHRGLRKVACIGAWHPARIQWQVPRAGQCGFHHRVAPHKKIYRIGLGGDGASAATKQDLTQKDINPLGGFPKYGYVKQDWLMIKGSVQGTKKRIISLRKALWPVKKRRHMEEVALKFIDTACKWGRGRFQTSEEKRRWFGPMKKDLLAAAATT